MNLVKCPNGHFYNADENKDCPYCNKKAEVSWKKELHDNIAKNKEYEFLHKDEKEYGLCAEYPVFVYGFDDNIVYLSTLRKPDGSKLTFKNNHPLNVKSISGPIFKYDAIDDAGILYGHVFISVYGTGKYIGVPEGFLRITDVPSFYLKSENTKEVIKVEKLSKYSPHSIPVHDSLPDEKLFENSQSDLDRKSVV